MKKIIFLTFFIFTIIIPNFSVAKNYDVSAHQLKIEYISYNAETYNDVLTGKFTSAKKVTLHGDLYIPTKDGNIFLLKMESIQLFCFSMEVEQLVRPMVIGIAI
jgi:hypothetical protein